MTRAAHLVSLIRQRRQRAPRQPAYLAFHALADRTEPYVRRIFRSAVAQTKKDTILAKLEFALAHHQVDLAMTAVPWAEVGAKILERRLTERLQRLIIASGTVAQRHQPPDMHLRMSVHDDKEALLQPADLSLSFDLKNPEAVRAALEESGTMIQGINDETLAGIRESIAKSVGIGRDFKQAAAEIRDRIGLTLRQQDMIDSLIEAATPEPEVSRAIKDALETRAKLIAQTETMRAANLGQQSLWRGAARSGLISSATATREWVAVPDEKECPICAELDGKTFGLEELIPVKDGTVLTPPAHPNCRCVLILNVK